MGKAAKEITNNFCILEDASTTFLLFSELAHYQSITAYVNCEQNPNLPNQLIFIIYYDACGQTLAFSHNPIIH